MSTPDALSWERRAARTVAVAALAALFLPIVAQFYGSTLPRPAGRGRGAQLLAVVENPNGVVVFGLLTGAGYALLALVLRYLFRATRHRRPEIPGVVGVLAVLGPVLYAVGFVVAQVALVSVAGDFAGGERTDARAGRLLTEGQFRFVGTVGLAGRVALGFAFFLVSLHAMRAGLLGRFVGTMGMVVGALFVLPLFAEGPAVLLTFWLGAVTLLVLDRWPGGRGPAWRTGEATPWPGIEQRAAAARERGGGAREEARPEPKVEPPPEREPSTEGEALPEGRPPPTRRRRKRR